MFPEDLKYSQSHEWVKANEDIAIIGITDFAVAQLSDLVFIDLPEVGSEVKAGEAFGEIESVKAVSDLNSPLSGTIVEVNQSVADQPESLVKDVYEEGWLIKIKPSDTQELENLLDAKSYSQITED